MSDPSDPAQVRQTPSSPPREEAGGGLVTAGVENQRLAPGPAQAAGSRQQVSAPVEFENLQALTRFLTGALILGGGELMQRLRYFQREAEADPQHLPALAAANQETTGDHLRYFTLGLFARGQKRVARGLRQGLYASLDVTRSILGGLDRLTDNDLARPLRRPVESRLKALGQEAAQVIDEGRLEEQTARYLAGQTVGDVIDDLLDYFAENPEVADLVKRQIGAQSAGLAGVVAENTRSVTVVGDYALEGLVRRLLRRRMRRDLPPSPYMGKPQTMYVPTHESQGDMEYVERNGS
jgi:hypothetical protein